MAARHYVHCFKAGSPGQTQDDDVRWSTTPHANAVRAGLFDLWFIPSEASAAITSARYLLSCDASGETLDFILGYTAPNLSVRVLRNGSVIVSRILTFAAGAELRFTFDAVFGVLTVSGAASGNGTSYGTPWNLPGDCSMRLGGNLAADGSEANGLVSLPYAQRRGDDGLAPIGADVLNLWQVDAAAGDFLTLNSGNVASVINRAGSGSGPHMAQATVGSQPLHHSNGGPGNIPYLEFQDVARYLQAATARSAGHRTACYVLMALPPAGAVLPETFTVKNSTQYKFEIRRGSSVPPLFSSYAQFTGGTQLADPTTPLFDTGWHLHAFLPMAMGARWEIDGVAVPNLFAGSTYTGSDTLVAWSDTFMGGPAGSSQGKVACVLQVNDPTDAKNDVAKQYFRQLTRNALPIG